MMDNVDKFLELLKKDERVKTIIWDIVSEMPSKTDNSSDSEFGKSLKTLKP